MFLPLVFYISVVWFKTSFILIFFFSFATFHTPFFYLAEILFPVLFSFLNGVVRDGIEHFRIFYFFFSRWRFSLVSMAVLSSVIGEGDGDCTSTNVTELELI